VADPTPEILKISDTYREALRRGEASAMREMAASYGRLATDLASRAADLAREIERMREAGEAVPPWRIGQLERYKELMAQAETELGRLGDEGAEVIEGLQRDGIRLGTDMADEQVTALIPPEIRIAFNRLPAEALESLVGFLQDGSPLARLLQDLGEDTARRIGELLQQGLGLGWNPRKVAAAIRREVGMALSRSMRIARTEMLRAWRRSSIENYRNQGNLIIGYRRCAQADDRTCIACLLMDGHLYQTEEEFTDHVQGRCAVIPVTRSWADLGFQGIPDTNAEWELGRDWFEGQDEATQRSIIGNALYDAWKSGDIALDDMATLHTSREWGDSWQQSSLKGAQENARNRVDFP
jgi:SPP1 gp7 family putative phage head morphogenesis protein